MKCKKIREKIVLHFYGELDEREKSKLEDHIKGCTACSEDFEYTNKVFHLLDESKEEVIPEGNWEKSWQGISDSLPEVVPRRRSIFTIPRWAYASAALVMVLVMGIFLGRYFFLPQEKPTLFQPSSAQDPSFTALQDHFEDIRPVLIELANYSPEEGDTILMDKKLVKGLLLQNLLLRNIVTKTNPSAAQLLEDLDLILKEMVNLEGEDMETPFLIKNLIYQRDILFKMEVYQDI